MNNYLSEDEQIQLVKDWLKKYAPSIILGVALALAISFGWRYWQQRQMQTADQASLIYEQMMMLNSKQQMDQANRLADDLMKNYRHTPYAGLAGFMLADNAVSQNNLDVAEKNLIWVSQEIRDNSLKQIAKIRAARILLEQNKLDQALKLISSINDKSYLPSANIVKGDILAAMGKKKDAYQAYQAALLGIPSQAPMRSFVEMKQNEVAL